MWFRLSEYHLYALISVVCTWPKLFQIGSPHWISALCVITQLCKQWIELQNTFKPFWELTLTCFEEELGLADLWGLFQLEWLCDPFPWASLLMVMSIISVVPIAFTQWMMYNNFYFLDGVFLYCLWKENSLLNLFVSLSVFLISFVTWYLLYLLICVIPHILNKLLLPYTLGLFFSEMVSPGIPDFLFKKYI